MPDNKKPEEKKVVGTTAIIDYKGTNLVTVPISKAKLVELEQAKAVSGKYKGKVRILPGNNVMNLAVWKAIRQEVMHLIKAGKIVEKNVTGDVEMGDKSYGKLKYKVATKIETVDLSDMDVKEAIMIIKKTHSLAAVDAFLNDERVTEGALVKALEAQKKEILKKTPGDDE